MGHEIRLAPRSFYSSEGRASSTRVTLEEKGETREGDATGSKLPWGINAEDEGRNGSRFICFPIEKLLNANVPVCLTGYTDFL